MDFDCNNLIFLIKKINKYEYNISKIILNYLENLIIYDYFSKYRVEIWFCYIHDQGFMIQFHKNEEKLNDIYTKTCCNYCHLEYIDDFNQDFIKNYYCKYSNYIDIDFKLSWFLNCFYDLKNDKFLFNTPLPIKLMYQKCITS
jgi:hypothetical protein